MGSLQPNFAKGICFEKTQFLQRKCGRLALKRRKVGKSIRNADEIADTFLWKMCSVR